MAGDAQEVQQTEYTHDAHKKLAFDELLRLIRSRTEDMERLMSMQNEQTDQETKGAEKFRQTCAFREEWRTEREDAALRKLQEESRDEIAEEDVLKAHIQCCVHMLVSGNSAVQIGPGRKTRRFQDLLYAKQMDRILNSIDKQGPGEVIRDVIMDMRARFQKLLKTGVLSRDTPRDDPIKTQTVCAQSSPAEQASDVLHLYENVVTAKASVAPAKRNAQLAPEFTQLLQRQRDEAEWKSNEALVKSHHQKLCLRQIVRAIRDFRRWREYQQKLALLRTRRRDRAARLLQQQFVPLCRDYRRLVSARERLLRRYQGITIATYCFWHWIYKIRCGFGSFVFTAEVPEALVHCVIRIQSHYRRKRAVHQVAYLREIRAIRKRKLEQKMWRQMQANMQALSDLDTDLAEWRHHIGVERQRAQDELVRESERFAAEWAKYKTKLRKDVMKSKLPSEWIPQMDQVSGEQYFLSIKTGRTVKEHPNLLLFEQLIAKQRVRADELFLEQQARLQDYIVHLDARLQERTQEILKEMVRRMHHHARTTESDQQT